MCTIPSVPHGFHSSVAHMIPARSYDRFLSEGKGCVDTGVINQFTQTVLTPPLFYQFHSDAANQRQDAYNFIKNCRSTWNCWALSGTQGWTNRSRQMGKGRSLIARRKSTRLGKYTCMMVRKLIIVIELYPTHSSRSKNFLLENFLSFMKSSTCQALE